MGAYEDSKNETYEWITTTSVLQGLRSAEDNSTWLKFVRYFRPALVSFAKRAGLQEADANDFSQHVLAEFVKAYWAGKYDPAKGRLKDWLYGIARRVLLRFLREKQAQRRYVSLTEMSSAGLPPAADENSTAALWQKEWQQMVLNICLDRVRTEFEATTFSAFQMYAVEGTPADEVAQRLHLTRNAVYIAKSRVLTKLRQLMKEFDE